MKKTRKFILLIGPVGEVGGVKTHVWHLSNVLQEYNHHIEMSRGLKFFDFLKYSFFHRPDLVIFNLSIYRNQIYRNIVFRYLFSLWKPHCVLHLHGGTFEGLNLAKPAELFLDFYLRSFNKIFCLTDEQKSFVDLRLPVTKSAEKIYNYVAIPPSQKVIKDEYYLDLLYAGRLHPDKGVMECIVAVKELNDPRIRFSIIGSGELEKEVATASNGQITYSGTLFGEEKERYFNKSHVFLLPSQHKEGLPYALLEAAAAGQVLVASNKGAISEVLKCDVNGYFISPRNVGQIIDVLKKLLSDRELLAKMGQSSRALAKQRFAIENLREKYFNILLNTNW